MILRQKKNQAKEKQIDNQNKFKRFFNEKVKRPNNNQNEQVEIRNFK